MHGPPAPQHCKWCPACSFIQPFAGVGTVLLGLRCRNQQPCTCSCHKHACEEDLVHAPPSSPQVTTYKYDVKALKPHQGAGQQLQVRIKQPLWFAPLLHVLACPVSSVLVGVYRLG